MFNKLDNLTGLDAAQVDAIRNEAIERYERCLEEATLYHFQHFVEYHLVHHSAQLDLFFNLADDLQQRLLALRGYHFDVRNRVLQLFLSMYQTDISPLVPADEWEDYHLTNPSVLIDCVRQQGNDLSPQEEAILLDVIQSSINACAQLYRDITLTEQLLFLLEDWLDAYKVVAVRQLPDWGRMQSTDGLVLIQ